VQTHSNDPSRSTSRWVFLYLGSANFLTAMGSLGLVSIMPAIGRRLDIPDYFVASIFSLSALVWALSSPAWIGPVGRHGATIFIRLGMLGFALSMGGCAFAVQLGLIGWTGPTATFLFFLIVRSIYGVCGSSGVMATQALVVARTVGADRTRALTGLAGAVSLGTIVGPALAPFLIFHPLGLIGPMAVFAVFGLLTFAVSFLFLPKTSRVASTSLGRPAAVSIQAIWRKPVVGRYLTFGLILSSAQAVNLYMIGFVLIDRMDGNVVAAQPLIGLTMTAGAAAALFVQWGLIRMLTISPQRMMQWGAWLALLGNGIAIAVSTPNGAAVGFVFASFGFGLARPGFSAASSLAATDSEQVAVASAASLIAGASIAAPPIIASLVYQIAPSAPFTIPIALLFALILGNLGGHPRSSIVHEER
jgi:MFS family permease